MKVYISIVSHGNSELIKSLGMIEELIKKYNVIIKSNKSGDDFSYIKSDNFYWINENYGLGFGNNNNVIFNFCKKNLNMNDSDYFLIVNPDVLISANEVDILLNSMEIDNISIAAINLFKDKSFSIYDNSIRKFPTLSHFVKSFLGAENSSILDKEHIKNSCYVDWASGSFLAFTSKHYEKLGGFDERYFMYCEDIDICWRSKKTGQSVTYFPEIKAVHLAKHANRNIFSKHFYWHFTGVLRFLLVKMGVGKSHSSIFFGKK